MIHFIHRGKYLSGYIAIQLISVTLGLFHRSSDTTVTNAKPTNSTWYGPYLGKYDILRLVTSRNEILLRHSNLTDLTAEQLQFYHDHININATKARLTFYQTLFQDNKRWRMERQIRITASNAYQLYTYAGSTKSPRNRTTYDWENKIGSVAIRDRPRNVYMQYGSYHEDVALRLLEKEVKQYGGYLRKSCGILVNTHLPWMAYSPDAIIKTATKTILVEVKCPYVGTVAQGKEFLKNVTFISLNSKTGEYKMRKRHSNYAQVQIGMLICNLPMAKMIIYCKKSQSITEMDIPFDEEYVEDLLIGLKQVYFKQFLPFLIKHSDKIYKTNNSTMDPFWPTGRNSNNVTNITNHWYQKWYQELSM